MMNKIGAAEVEYKLDWGAPAPRPTGTCARCNGLGFGYSGHGEFMGSRCRDCGGTGCVEIEEDKTDEE